MRKKLVSIFLGVTMAAFFVGCQSAKTAENKKDNGKVDVTVSIEPLREFTEIVGGDKVNVKTMVPNGTEPHDFEPKTQDLLELNKAKVFVYNGLGMEHWKEQV
ncbi:MAG: zinc ABC transporter substrate-binding protein, partial [Clostridium perfringens]|nr:zinc ABC transporter substrate-binding protein [Clostridium perfringens]